MILGPEITPANYYYFFCWFDPQYNPYNLFKFYLVMCMTKTKPFKILLILHLLQ